MNPSRFFQVIIAAIWISFVGCMQHPNAEQNVRGTVKISANPIRQPTDADCRLFAERLMLAIQSRQPEKLNRLIDYDAILSSAMAGIECPEDLRIRYRERVLKSLREPPVEGLGGSFVRAIGQANDGGSFELLRIRHLKGRRYAQYRMLANSGDLNYFEFELSLSKTGIVSAVDVFDYVSSEKISQLVRKRFLSFVSHENRNLLQRLTMVESDFVRNIGTVDRFYDALYIQDFPRVRALYKALPTSLQTEKSFLLGWLQASKHASDQEYAVAIKRFRDNFPNDACVDLLSIDYFFLQKRYDDALRCIDQLERQLGDQGDPYLNSLRGDIEFDRQRWDLAKGYFLQACEAMPNYPEVWWSLVSVSLAEKNFDETVRLLDLLRNRFSIDIADLTKLSDYAEFVQSQQYANWKRVKT